MVVGSGVEEKDEMENVMKILCGKKGIEQRQASEVNEKKVEYFRGKDLEKWILDTRTATIHE